MRSQFLSSATAGRVCDRIAWMSNFRLFSYSLDLFFVSFLLDQAKRNEV